MCWGLGAGGYVHYGATSTSHLISAHFFDWGGVPITVSSNVMVKGCSGAPVHHHVTGDLTIDPHLLPCHNTTKVNPVCRRARGKGALVVEKDSVKKSWRVPMGA